MGVRVVALVVTLSLSTSLSTAAAEPVSATEAKVLGADQAGAVPNSYIVRIKDSASPKSRSSLTAKDLTAKYGGTVKVAWQNALNGFAVSMNPEQARRLAADPRVALVEQDAQVHAVDVQPNPPSWGLDRVDQRDLPLNNTYTFDATAGNVHAYVIDTGIRVTHSAFGGRATWGHNSIDTDDTDCNGHGTHVAGTIGGNQYGVAQGVQLVAVKVLDCTANGTFEQVIDGVNWVAQNAVKPAVANMSLGGQASSPAMEDAVRAAIASGVTFTIASGNGNTDASTYTPAKVTEAITVNASTPTDARAAFSNFGPCTDLYAPGTDIVSAWNTDDNATHVDGGTSMAAPHVTGAAALWLASHPNDSPAAVQAALIAQATPDKVTDPGAGSPNKLLFTNPTLAPVIVVPGPQVGTIGVQFNLQLSAFGGAGPYTWDATNLPDGLSVNDAGLLSGSPTTRGLSTVTITATDSAGKSGTATFTLMVKAACQAGQLIANPGFESGADSWITTPGVIVPGTAAQPTHSGTMFAWLDGYGAIHTDTVTQTVTLPFDCGTYTLSYWLHIDSTEPTTTTVFDSMNVLVGTKTLASYTNLDKADGYQLRTFDLSQFAGQTVTLTFTGTEDASLQTSFVVDDVGLTVG